MGLNNMKLLVAKENGIILDFGEDIYVENDLQEKLSEQEINHPNSKGNAIRAKGYVKRTKEEKDYMMHYTVVDGFHFEVIEVTDIPSDLEMITHRYINGEFIKNDINRPEYIESYNKGHIH